MAVCNDTAFAPNGNTADNDSNADSVSSIISASSSLLEHGHDNEENGIYSPTGEAFFDR